MTDRKTYLKLYDFCIVLNRGSGTTDDIAQELGITIRTAERRLALLKQAGIEIDRTRESWENRYTNKLKEPLETVLKKLDALLGIRPHPVPSLLPEEKQEEILRTYNDLLEGRIRHWPYHFFDCKEREEKLRVIIPHALEEIIKKAPAKTRRKDLEKAKLSRVRDIHYKGSAYRLLKTTYPWLQPWEMGKVRRMWSGKGADERKKQAITWLVEEMLPYTLEELPERISVDDFVRHGLGGLLCGHFNTSPYEAVNFAYPGRFKKWQFYYSRDKWSGKEGFENAREAIRAMVEDLGISPSELKKVKVEHFEKYRLSGLLTSKNLGFRRSIKRALQHAYPEAYGKEKTGK